MTTTTMPCPDCGAEADFISVTYEPDENEYYYDIHLCKCGKEFLDLLHPLLYDYDNEDFIEVETPKMSREAQEQAGQLRLFEE